ncbi:AMIN domain-containing protein [Oligoflexia bacterium]|nr:AMIN domain-containing protein [Oligoflexia bacterium]
MKWRTAIGAVLLVLSIVVCGSTTWADTTLVKLEDKGLVLKLVERASGFRVQIDSRNSGPISGAETLNAFAIENPVRLVIDLPAIKYAKSHKQAVAHKLISKVRIGVHADKIRVVIDITKNLEVTSALVSRGVGEIPYIDFGFPTLQAGQPKPTAVENTVKPKPPKAVVPQQVEPQPAKPVIKEPVKPQPPEAAIPQKVKPQLDKPLIKEPVKQQVADPAPETAKPQVRGEKNQLLLWVLVGVLILAVCILGMALLFIRGGRKDPSKNIGPSSQATPQSEEQAASLSGATSQPAPYNKDGMIEKLTLLLSTNLDALQRKYLEEVLNSTKELQIVIADVMNSMQADDEVELPADADLHLDKNLESDSQLQH